MRLLARRIEFLMACFYTRIVSTLLGQAASDRQIEAYYIRAGTGIPNKAKPSFNVMPAQSLSARRISRRFEVSAEPIGQSW
jgi:hypothetical protein